LCPPAARPRPDIIARAATFLKRHTPGIRQLIAEDFHCYLPATHAVRGMLLISGKRWAKPEWARSDRL
jgi:hypothetical protein